MYCPREKKKETSTHPLGEQEGEPTILNPLIVKRPRSNSSCGRHWRGQRRHTHRVAVESVSKVFNY